MIFKIHGCQREVVAFKEPWNVECLALKAKVYVHTSHKTAAAARTKD